jgi:superfamily II DNA or RNA helicase
MAGQPIMLRDYQVEAIKRYLENPQSIQSISTGAGKTLLTAALSKLCEPYGRTIVIVPSKSLVEQTEEDYRNLGLDVGVFFGDRKEWGHKHTICTWQSLTVFSKKDKDGRNTGPSIREFLEGVVTVMVDEVHSAKADELTNLLTGPMAHLPIRWGLTGTVPKEDFEFFSILASLGPVVGEIRAADLQEQGVLANCNIEIMKLNDDHMSFSSYPDELEFLCTDPERLQFVADYCAKLSQSGNTMILVDRIETGRILTKAIPGAVFVSGETKSKDRKKEYKDVQFNDGKVIIATYGVAAVGINIPRLFNVVLFEAGKSFVRVIQSIGRGLRKSGDKDSVNIKDICSSCKFSNKHSNTRKAYYKEAQYKHSVTKVEYR